jgi:hypothetical protein
MLLMMLMMLMILAFQYKSQGLRRVVTLFVVDDDEDDEQLFSFSETTRLGHITLTLTNHLLTRRLATHKPIRQKANTCRYFYKVSA